MCTQWALHESSKDGDAPAPDETPWRGGDFNGGPTEPSGSFPYRLVSMIRHVGPSAKAGHYVCDVWNPKTRMWKEYVKPSPLPTMFHFYLCLQMDVVQLTSHIMDARPLRLQLALPDYTARWFRLAARGS
jgi:hypothetical protein